MKHQLIGRIPLIGCGFYPSKILERIILLQWISRESPEVIEEDFASFRRLKIQNFKDGFTWILPGGASFFIQLRGQLVSIYSVDREDVLPPPALPVEIGDLLAEEWPSVPELSADAETLPEAFDLEDPILPESPEIAVEATWAGEVPALGLPHAEAPEEGVPGPRGEEFTVRFDGRGREVGGAPEPGGLQLEFSFDTEDEPKPPAPEAPGEMAPGFYSKVQSAKDREGS